MDTSRVFVVAVVLVTVLALALGAPTLADLTEDDGSDGAGDGSPAAQADEAPGDGPELDFEEGNDEYPVNSPTPIIIAGLLIGLVMALALIYGIGPGRMAVALAGVLGICVVLLVLVHQLTAWDIPRFVEDPNVWGEVGLGDETGDGADEVAGDGSEAEAGDSLTSLAVSVGTVLALLGAVVLGVAVLYYYSAEEDSEEETVADLPESDERSPDARDLGEAAGRALEGDETPAENSIYRAWVEMTDELDVENRPVRTPTEFEQAAIDAGMAPTHVEELTDLFRSVRYGEDSVTDAREQEAKDILEQIRRAYGSEPEGVR